MLFINYKGNTPQQRYYSLGVKGDNKANSIKFVIPRQQADLDLSEYVCNLKVQNKTHEYADLIALQGAVDLSTDTIEFVWEMTQKSTQYRNLELQLELVGENGVVWQTLIVELELNETLPVGEQVSEKELSVIKQLELEIKELKQKVDSSTKLYIHKITTNHSTYYVVDKNPEKITYDNDYRLVQALVFYRWDDMPCLYDFNNSIVFVFNGGQWVLSEEIDDTSIIDDEVSHY